MQPVSTLTYAANTHTQFTLTSCTTYDWLFTSPRGQWRDRGGEGCQSSCCILYLLWQSLLQNLFAICGGNTSNNNNCCSSVYTPLSHSISLSVSLSFSLFAACLICCEIALLFQRVHLRFARLVARACCLLPAVDKRLCICVCVRCVCGVCVTPS